MHWDVPRVCDAKHYGPAISCHIIQISLNVEDARDGDMVESMRVTVYVLY